MNRSALIVGCFLAAAGLLSSACTEKKKPEKGAGDGVPPAAASGDAPKNGEPDASKPSAKEAAKIMAPLPGADLVDPVVNPRKLPAYTGPTGTIVGVVKATGDKAPELPKVLSKVEQNCTRARSMFGVLFREGPERELADVLVAVTQYDGYVPSKGTDVEVWGEGCAWESRTIAMTYGQRLTIKGADNRPYVPELLGQPMPAQLFVLPSAPPVQIPPKKPGRYQLVDSMRLYNVAEVYVLPYATATVTKADGKFELKGIPVGEVQINALLPQTESTEGKTVKVEAGKVTEVTFELPFDQAAYDKKPKPTPLDELPAPGERRP